MIISGVKTVLLTGPCTNDPFLSECRKRRSAAFIEIYTDTEIKGIGETYAGYFIPEIVPGIVEFFAPILIGKDPGDIDTLWAHMYHCGNFWCRTGVGLQVLTGIEAALWDIRGKVSKMPVYKLLSNKSHDRLFCYATGGASNYPIDKFHKKIEYYMSLGFNAVKVGVGEFHKDRFITSKVPEEAAEIEYNKLRAVKQRFGNELKFMLDGHMGNWPNFDTIWRLDTAKAVMKALEKFQIFFFEEPLHYNDRHGYRELTASTDIPIAGGECLAGLVEWRPYIEEQCFNIGQPDAAYVGGLSEFMKIAALMSEKGQKLATHSWAAGGGFMQNIHAGFAASNTAILEIAPDYGPLHSEIIGESFIMKDGYVYPPEKPGLGIELTDRVKEKFPFVKGSGEFNSVPGKILRD